MRWAVLLLAGCGRFGFDESAIVVDAAPDTVDAMPCVPTNAHDEDGDGVADSCDVCPHLAGPQADRDGDRVGDACDPQPEVPREHIAMFDPLTTLTGWSLNGTVSASADSVKLASTTGDGGRIARSFMPGRDAITIGVRTSLRGTGQHLFGVFFVETFGGQTVYCEQYSDGTGAALLVTYTLDGAMFVHPDGVESPPIDSRTTRMTATIDPTTIGCRLETTTVDLRASGARPIEIVPVTLSLYAENVVTELDYVLQIRTDP